MASMKLYFLLVCLLVTVSCSFAQNEDETKNPMEKTDEGDESTDTKNPMEKTDEGDESTETKNPMEKTDEGDETTTPVEPEEPEGDDGVDCSADGIFPHAGNCRKFVECEGGRKFVKKCGPGTAYNKQIEVCDWPQNSDCAEST